MAEQTRIDNDRSSFRIRLEHNQDQRTSYREMIRDLTGNAFTLYVSLFEGNATLKANGRQIYKGLIKPGMMGIASPGQRRHHIHNSPTDCALLHIPQEKFKFLLHTMSVDSRAADVGFINTLQGPNVQVYQLGRLLLSESSLDSANAQLSTDGITDALLARLLQTHQIQCRTPRNSDLFSPSDLKRCFEFADAHLRDGVDTETWAATLGIPGAEFARRFRLTVGQTPYAWFVLHRMECAKTLLLETRDPIIEIARQLGFSSQSHFTEAFRRQVGMGPAHWRSVHRAGRTRSLSGKGPFQL